MIGFKKKKTHETDSIKSIQWQVPVQKPRQHSIAVKTVLCQTREKTELGLLYSGT